MATDSAGNSAPASFNVNVEDHELPSLSQGDIAQNTDPGQAYATISFTPSASDNSGYATVNCTPGSGSTFSIGVVVSSYSITTSDNSGEPVAVDCSPAEGYAFPIGSSSVSCTATDPSGNTASAVFVINVADNSSSTPQEP